MTHRQRMLAAIRGEPADRVTWAPRLDLWFRANKLAGTLPDRFRNATLDQLVDDLGWVTHAIVPNFKELGTPDDDLDRPLGIYNLPAMPVRTVLHEVRRSIERDGDRTIVIYDTPAGPLRTITVYDEAMRRAGVTITHVAEYAFKSPADYEPLGWLFEHAEVQPNFDSFAAFRDRVGQRGLAAGFLSLAGSPMHLIQRELMPVDTFFYEMTDRPAELALLAERIGVYYDRLFAVAAECPADIFLLGANYDSSVTYPPFFAEHIGPWLRKFARMIHPRGRLLLTHTDGENSGLLEHYVAAEIDVADSICPSPMTRLSIRQVRDAFAGRVAIMGGVPSVALLQDSLDDVQFERFCDEFFEQIGQGDHLILGVSDTTPPATKFDRLIAIAKRVEQFPR